MQKETTYIYYGRTAANSFEIFLSVSNDYGSTFSQPVNISNDTGQSGTPEFVLYGDNIYVVWMDNSSGNFDIMFSKSTDNGRTFSTPIDVSKLHKDSGYPQLAVSGDNVYVVWTQTVTSTNYDIYFARSSDKGATFDNPVNLSNNIGASGWPKIMSNGHIVVSWVDSTPGRFDVMISKSSDQGKTFDNYTNVSNSSKESYEHDMALENDIVYLVWQEGQKGNHNISFAKSTTFVPEFGPSVEIALIIAIVAIITLSIRSRVLMQR